MNNEKIKEKIEIAKKTHNGDVFYTFVLIPLFYKIKNKIGVFKWKQTKK